MYLELVLPMHGTGMDLVNTSGMTYTVKIYSVPGTLPVNKQDNNKYSDH